jgi:hypothetical protein
MGLSLLTQYHQDALPGSRQLRILSKNLPQIMLFLPSPTVKSMKFIRVGKDSLSERHPELRIVAIHRQSQKGAATDSHGWTQTKSLPSGACQAYSVASAHDHQRFKTRFADFCPIDHPISRDFQACTETGILQR